MHNLGIAVANFSGSKNGGLPYVDEPVTLPIGTNAAPVQVQANWPVSLLAYLDRQDIVETLSQQVPANPSQNLVYLTSIALDVLTCPDDNLHFKQGGGLSYVGNCGYGNFPVNANGQMSEAAYAPGTPPTSFHTLADPTWSSIGADGMRDTGVFTRAPIPNVSTDRFRMSTDRISNRDGTSNTILFAENLNARNWGGLSTNYGYPTAGTSDFTCVLDTGFIANVNFGASSEVALTPNSLSPSAAVTLTYSRLNADKGKHEGRYPVPSSLHPGIVVTAFADGRAKALADNIDNYVYVRLISSGGTRRGQAPLSDSDY
jgi:hypothetical protein